MQERICISCGLEIYKKSHSDPHLCNYCEDITMVDKIEYAHMHCA